MVTAPTLWACLAEAGVPDQYRSAASLAFIRFLDEHTEAMREEAAAPTDDDEGNAHVTEPYRQTVNGEEWLGWECVTCLTHERVMRGPGMGREVPPAHLARLDELGAAHVRVAASVAAGVTPQPGEQQR